MPRNTQTTNFPELAIQRDGPLEPIPASDEPPETDPYTAEPTLVPLEGPTEASEPDEPTPDEPADE